MEGMHTATEYDPLPGLRYRTIGLTLLREAMHNEKNKKRGKQQRKEEIADSLAGNQENLQNLVTDKVAALARVGRGRARKRKRSRSVSSRSRSVGRKMRKIKKGRRRRGRKGQRGRRRGRKSKKNCLKGTIFS